MATLNTIALCLGWFFLAPTLFALVCSVPALLLAVLYNFVVKHVIGRHLGW